MLTSEQCKKQTNSPLVPIIHLQFTLLTGIKHVISSYNVVVDEQHLPPLMKDTL